MLTSFRHLIVKIKQSARINKFQSQYKSIYSFSEKK
jgi:hypothetical protein